MFGYLRPMQGELKVHELERFKACYCGLCHTLGKDYGVASRFILGYEFVFLSMLLWDADEPVIIKRKRCIASPFRKRPYCARNGAYGICAAYSVILTWWKLRDTVADEPFFKTIPHRLGLAALRGAYRKAVREFPEFAGRVTGEMVRLAEYESGGDASLDGAADKFARILRAAAPAEAPDEIRRPLLELLYHLGRWIYIIDACDDYAGDSKAGRYNPVAAKYPPEGGKLPDDGADRIKATLTHSNNLLSAAFELLPENDWTETVRNTIYLGLPDVCARVLAGNWPPARRK